MPASRFEAVTADIDERAIQAASKLSNPREIGLLLAREKAMAVSLQIIRAVIVIGADQTLALGDKSLQQAGRARAGDWPSNCAISPARAMN